MPAPVYCAETACSRYKDKPSSPRSFQSILTQVIDTKLLPWPTPVLAKATAPPVAPLGLGAPAQRTNATAASAQIKPTPPSVLAAAKAPTAAVRKRTRSANVLEGA
ncbi:hypothetical protein BDN71DRAFT_1438851 [Pleurotus eryngii]|uniref:Uncharacterized protein n=1 Tax=Pleurotus eryngii TaxID=5323 RepID=A0A9P6A838_PLEER|nr:hypothetical protein BDN71DRAFT_1438851 [Pleurotus eryngii]